MDVELEKRAELTHVLYDICPDFGVSRGCSIELVGERCKETIACKVSRRVK